MSVLVSDCMCIATCDGLTSHLVPGILTHFKPNCRTTENKRDYLTIDKA